MSNRGYGNTFAAMRPNYYPGGNGGGDRDRYFNRGDNYDNRPEYYERYPDKYGERYPEKPYGGYRGGNGNNGNYGAYDDRGFRPWDQTYTYVLPLGANGIITADWFGHLIRYNCIARKHKQ